MAGRNHIPPESLNSRRQSSPPRHQTHRPIITHEIQTLLSDNQRLAAAHVALKQELAVALQDLRHFSSAAANIKAEREAEVREVFEKAIKMESEVRIIDEMKSDLGVVKSDIIKLLDERKELNEKLELVVGEIGKEKANGSRVLEIREEIDSMRNEVQKGKAAIEYEKKVYASNIEQNQAMEKSKISMTHEIEKLKAELANAEKKVMAVAAAAATNTPGTTYAAGFVNRDMGYGGNAYPTPYAGHQVPQYGSGPVPPGMYGMQPGIVDPQYVPAVVPHVPYDMQHPNAHG
uniref:protein FLC EXPRESSOR n=1 Tax=Erigeron canadensis TaxID=72917 RepID=UPI001CB98939|nr:protein FLC EXPRESSOR [Erigeron canadensis]